MSDRSAESTGWFSLVLGPLIGLGVYWLVPESYVGPEGTQVLGEPARRTAGVAAWMATWWLTETVHISITALLPLAVFPLLEIRSMQEAASPYANDLIYLFLGGFILSLSMQRWGLHRRIALTTLGSVGTRPRRIVGGFMVVTAILSMWVSNTATAVMMLPIAMSVLELDGEGELDGETPPFATALLLGVAYGASIGGVGTIIGTPPNVFLASYLAEQGYELGFGEWMAVGIPFVAVFLPLAWLLLTRVLFELDSEPIEGGAELIEEELASLDSMNRGERITLVVFVSAALAWVFRGYLTELTVGGIQPLAGLTDTGIAMIASMALFLAPAGEGNEKVMNWETARELPWGILVLFGGGLSLAAAVDETGIGGFLGAQVEILQGVPGVVIIGSLTILVVLLTELTSNTATTATLLPILAGIAPAVGLDPMLLLVPAAMAASCAFMLPVATPPNAVVFGSGHISVAQMRNTGIWLNLVAVGLITATAYTLIAYVLL